MKTAEELKKELAALDAKLEAAKLEKELKAKQAELSKIEFVDPSAERLAVEMKNAAQKADLDNFTKANADRIAKEEAKKNAEFTEKQAKAEVRFTKEAKREIEKQFGSKKDTILDLAKDLKDRIVALDFLAQGKKCHISETEMFKNEFGNFSRGEVDAAVKALATGSSNAGAEYVLTGWQDQIAARLADSNVALANLPVIDLPNNPYRIPVYTALPTTYYCTEGSTIGASDPTTDKNDLDARKIANYVKYSGEMEEDSIVAVRPLVERIMMESLSNGIERVILFGDTVATASTNINLIDGTPTTTAGSASVYLTRDGLIKTALLGSNGKKKDINSDIMAGFAGCLQLMGVGAANPRDLVAFVAVELLFKYMANSSFITYDKAGALAGILNGAPGALFGVPVFASSGIPKTNSAGKIPAAGGTLGSVLIAKKSGCLVGFKRRPTLMDVQGLQTADQFGWIASARVDVKAIQGNEADRAAVAYGYNAGL